MLSRWLLLQQADADAVHNGTSGGDGSGSGCLCIRVPSMTTHILRPADGRWDQSSIQYYQEKATPLPPTNMPTLLAIITSAWLPLPHFIAKGDAHATVVDIYLQGLTQRRD